MYLKDDFKNTVKVACIYITTIIGAGFASGQEIASFFSTYYTGGFFGIILSGILFSAIGVLVLDRVYRERITGYNELLLSLVGKRLASVMEVIVTLFMLSLFIIMVSGMGSVIKEETGIGFFPASAAMCFLCYLVIVTNIRGIVAVSTALTPLLIAGMAVTGLYVILFKDLQAGGNGFILERVMDNWFLSSLTYVSYNSIMSIVMMSSLLPYLKSRKTGVAGGIIGGAVLCLIAMIINTAIFLFYPDILSKELPMLERLYIYFMDGHVYLRCHFRILLC